MADSTPQSTKAPWHLWLVGVVAVLWNAMGALDFTLTQMRSEAYLKGCTPEQIAYFTGLPLWVLACWGIATWGGLVGSLLLLLRRGWAAAVFGASLVTAIATMIWNYGLSDGLKVMNQGLKPLVFAGAVLVIAVLLLVYARAMRGRGVLR